jgi:N-methylhydantoinase A
MAAVPNALVHPERVVSAVPQISIDIGGTFIDVLLEHADGRIASRKLLHDEQAPAAIVATALADLGCTAGEAVELLYSSTAALNSLLTGSLPAIGLIVTSGFRDLMETARYAPASVESPTPRRLVALEHVREISARMAPDGSERRAVVEQEIVEIAEIYRALGIKVVAVALIHSYANLVHEQRVRAIFDGVAPEIRVVLSAEVLPELREYERALATCLNAALVPILEEHVAQFSAATDRGAALYMMQASGGLSSAVRAAMRPLTTVLAGPGAAVVGMSWLGQESGYGDLITLDIGGTSTDVAVVQGGMVGLTTAGKVAGFPLKLPLVDVLSIGAGGGSVASVAPDGRWHVGPGSAGAAPGPVCYGRGGTAVTLTDAELVLGRLPEALLGGTLPLDIDAATRALTAFGQPRGLDALATARGILEIASHAICGAIRRVAMLRGCDPRLLTLFAMGGAGPLHAAELATLLGVQAVVVPPQPGLAAAYGTLVSDVTADLVRGLGVNDDAFNPDMVENMFGALHAQADALLAADNVAPALRAIERKLDLRYAGMTHEVTITCPQDVHGGALIEATIERFHRRFEELSGHSRRGREPVEIVNLRVTARGLRGKPKLSRVALASVAPVQARTRRAVQFLGQADLIETPIYDRRDLGHGTEVAGPAVIEQFESTIILPPDWLAAGDAFGNLILRPVGG